MDLVPSQVRGALETKFPEWHPERITESDQGDGVVIYGFFGKTETGEATRIEIRLKDGHAELLLDDSLQDLSAWRQIGAPVWRIANDGAAAGPAEELAYLVSRQPYADFRLRVEFRIDDDTNSGVFLRCTEPLVVADINPDDCYEVNIFDHHPNQDFRTGSIVTLATPKVHANTLGRWNQYDIVASGPLLEVTLNGEKLLSIVNERAASGYLALQYAGKAKLQFRNLRITAL